MRAYNILIQDYDGNLVEETPLVEYHITMDYLISVKSSVVLPFISNAKQGYFVDVYDPAFTLGATSRRVYLGFVSDVIIGKNTTTLFLLPFESLINFNIYYSTSTLSTSLEQWLIDLVTSVFETNADPLMNRFDVYGFPDLPATTGADLGIEGNIFNLFNLLPIILFKYGVIFRLSGNSTVLQVSTLKSGSSSSVVRFIETTNPNVLDVSLDFPNNVLNKVVYVNSDDESEKLTYYLKTDGTVSTDATTDRILPVIQDTIYYKPETSFSTETAILAGNALMLNENNYLIELYTVERQVLQTEKPFNVLGRKYKIIHNGVTYIATLTGFEMLSGETTKLIFGSVRADLTSLLGLERR